MPYRADTWGMPGGHGIPCGVALIYLILDYTLVYKKFASKIDVSSYIVAF